MHQLCAIGQPEFLHGSVTVGFDSLDGEREHVRCLLGRVSFGREPNYLPLALG